MTEPSLGNRFMAAFIAIEQHMKRSLYGDRDVTPGFKRLLDEYASKRNRYLTRDQKDALNAFRELRNAISHQGYYGGRAIADPVPEVVEGIERLRDRMIRPPLVIEELARGKPETVQPDSPVSQALATMYENDYSQLPVYDAKTYIGLLTTNTIARWLADQMRQSGGLAESEPIRTVLQFAEPDERVLHVAKSTTVAEVIYRFSHGAETGRPVCAVILTETGRADGEAALALVVSEDLIRLSEPFNFG